MAVETIFFLTTYSSSRKSGDNRFISLFYFEIMIFLCDHVIIVSFASMHVYWY